MVPPSRTVTTISPVVGSPGMDGWTRHASASEADHNALGSRRARSSSHRLIK